MITGLLILSLVGGVTHGGDIPPLRNQGPLSLVQKSISKIAPQSGSRLKLPDQLLRVGSSMLIAADWLMTIDGLRKGYRETNPLLGAHPPLGKANLMIGAGLLTNAFLVPKIKDRELRRAVWFAMTLIEANALHTNMQTGLHLNFRL